MSIWKRPSHKAGPRHGERLGTLKIGETLLPITHLRFERGLLVVTASMSGPVAADHGTSTVFDLAGKFIISNVEPTGFRTVPRDGTLIVVLPVQITPVEANPLEEISA